MKEKRFAQYLLKKRHSSAPIQNREEVVNNPDQHIDQDYPGYPHLPSDKKWISPETKEEKKALSQDENPTNQTGTTITSTSKDKKK